VVMVIMFKREKKSGCVSFSFTGVTIVTCKVVNLEFELDMNSSDGMLVY